MKGKVPESFISEIADKIDIATLIGARVKLRKAGVNFIGNCPFHVEKTPSFTVNTQKQFYHCFGCGVHGDAINFLMAYDKLSFIEAVEELASKLGLQVPYEVWENQHSKYDLDKAVANGNKEQIYALLLVVNYYFQQQLKDNKTASEAVNYLKSRGITGEMAKEFAIGYAPPEWDSLKRYMLAKTQYSVKDLEQAGVIIFNASQHSYDRFRQRIMFPIRDRRGRVIGFGGRVIDATEPKYLNSPETIVFRKGEELYGLYEANKKVRKLTFLLVVEGYLDVLALAQAGIHEVVATLGTALTAEHLQLLFRLVPEVIFCFDADHAGYKAAIRALELALPKMHGEIKVKFLFLPEGEDPDSFVRSQGREVFWQMLQRSMSLADFLFREVLKDMNLEAIEDRAQIVFKARNWLEQLPEGVFKQLMYERLARLVSLDQQTIMQQANTVRQQKNYPVKANFIRGMKQTPKSPALVALALLLKDRTLISEVDMDFIKYQTVELRGIQLLCAVIELLQVDKNLSTEQIMAKLPVNLAKHLVVEELYSLVAVVPVLGIREEFVGALLKIKLLSHEQNLEILLGKAKISELSADEKLRLQQLLMEKNLV